MSKTKFDTAFEAGYYAGMFGANKFNCHHSFFRTKQSTKEWQRGNDMGSHLREQKKHDKTKTIK